MVPMYSLQGVEGKPFSKSHQGKVRFTKSRSSHLPRKPDDIAVERSCTSSCVNPGVVMVLKMLFPFS